MPKIFPEKSEANCNKVLGISTTMWYGKSPAPYCCYSENTYFATVTK
jgi:hypothetical protein